MKYKAVTIIVILLSCLQLIAGCEWVRDQFMKDYDIVQKSMISILSEDIYSFECTVTATCQTGVAVKNDNGICELEDINKVFSATVDRINQIVKIEPNDSEKILYVTIADNGLDLYVFTGQEYIFTRYQDPLLAEAVTDIFFASDPDFLHGEGSGFAENEVRPEYDYASDRTIDAGIFYKPFELIANTFYENKPPLTIMIYLDKGDENNQIIIDTINNFDSGFTELFMFCYNAYNQQPLNDSFTKTDANYFYKCSITLQENDSISSIILPSTD